MALRRHLSPNSISETMEQTVGEHIPKLIPTMISGDVIGDNIRFLSYKDQAQALHVLVLRRPQQTTISKEKHPSC